MNIRDQEDQLFDKWSRKEYGSPFIKDGCPSPTIYENQKLKIVFILKEANFGLSYEEQNSKDYNQEPYDQRLELQEKPYPWWRKVSNWCLPIINQKMNWDSIISADIANALAAFAFIQLKKNAGGGTSDETSLWEAANSDKEEILTQLAIYKPNIIICCGVGEIFYKTVLSGNDPLKYTPNGVGYWKDIMPNDKAISIIDFCHPAARFGNKIERLIAYGLGDAVHYLQNGKI